MRTPRSLFASSLLLASSVAVAAASGCSDDETTPSPSTATDASTSSDASSGADSSSASDGSTANDSGSGDAGGLDATTSADAAPDSATTSGGPFGLVYSGAFNGIDNRVVTATLNGAGELRGYTFSANEAPVVLTASVGDVFADGFANAGRWHSGTVGGPFYDDGGVKTLSATEAQHYGLARVKPAFPASGSATYTLVGSTKPTIGDGSKPVGNVTAGSLTASFGGAAGTVVGFSLSLTMDDGSFDLVGNGGSTNVGDAGTPYTSGDAGFYFAAPGMTVSTDAGACPSGTCTSTASRITFAGPNLERIVLAFVFGPGSLTGARRGVAVFQRQ